MQGPIDRRDSGTGGVIAFGHRWSHCSRAYMLRWDPDTNGPCLATQAQMVLLHLGTDGPLHSGTDGPLHSGTDGPLHSGTDGPLHSGTDGPFTFFFSLSSQAQMVLLHLGADGPLHSGIDGPFTFFFLFFFFFFSFFFFLGTDGPVAFGHRWSLAFRHRWSLYIFFSLSQAQTVLLVSGTDGPVYTIILLNEYK